MSDIPGLIDATSSTPGSMKSSPSQASSELADHITTVTPPSPQVVEPLTKHDLVPRVLLVDDNSINLNLMLTFIKRRQLGILVSAENGELAVNAVERRDLHG